MKTLSWGWLIPIFLLTFWLGARGLTTDSLWSDEWMSLRSTGAGMYGPHNLADIWNWMATEDPWHPPGYFMILNGWGRLTGWTPGILRALSLLAGVLVIAWTYRLGRDWVSPKIGIYAAAILSTSAFLVNYLHELRVYMVLVLLSVFVIWLYLKLLYARRPPPIWAWLVLGVTVTVSMYNHYFAVIVLGALGIYHVILAPKRRRWLMIAGAVIVGGLLFLPWVNNMLKPLRHTLGEDWLNNQAHSLIDAILFLLNLFTNSSLVLMAFIAVFIVVALFKQDSQRFGRRMLIALSAASVVNLLVLNAIMQLLTVNRPRYMLVLWPLAAVVTGIGMVQFGEWVQRHVRWRHASAAAGGLLLGVWVLLGAANTLNPRYVTDLGIDGPGLQFLPAHMIPELLRGRVQPNDDVIVYLPTTMTRGAAKGIVRYYMDNFPAHFVFPDYFLDVDDLKGSPHAWIVSTLDNDQPDVRVADDARTALAGTHEYCGTAARNGFWNVALYQPIPGCCPAQTTADSTVFDFGEGIRVTGFAVQPVNPYGELPVQVTWSLADNAPFQNYSTTLEIAPTGGTKIAQQDYGLPYGFRCKTTEIDVRSLPPGSYEVRLGVYPWRTGIRVQGTNVSTGEQSDLLSIGTFTLP